MNEENEYYVQPYQDGFYFIKSRRFRGIIATLYGDYITEYTPLDKTQRQQIYSALAHFVRSVQKFKNEKREKQPIA